MSCCQIVNMAAQLPVLEVTHEPDNVNQKISLYMIPLQAATPVYSTTPLFWHSTRTLSIKIHAYLYSGRTKSAMVLGSPS